jgi:hypothetical protein
MLTVTFKSVLEGVATRMGLEPSANLQLNQAAALTEYITDRLAKFWELAAWPEWTAPELRHYRANWDAAATYALGAEVYSQNAYYRSLQAGNSNHLTSDTAWWTPASDLNTYVEVAQSWEANTIGRVWGVYADDPRKHSAPRKVSWWIGPEGVWVDTSLTAVYVDFSTAPPAFTTAAWDAATAYVPGDLVYYLATGDCYRAIAASTGVVPTTSASWKLQAFPEILSRTVKLAAIGDALREDENVAKAGAWDLQADVALTDALDRMAPAMRIQPSFSLGK